MSDPRKTDTEFTLPRTTFLETLSVGIDGFSVSDKFYAYEQRVWSTILSHKKRKKKVKRVQRSFVVHETHGTVRLIDDIPSLTGIDLEYKFTDCEECHTRSVIRATFDSKAQAALAHWRRTFGPWHRVHVHGQRMVSLELIFPASHGFYAKVRTAETSSFEFAKELVDWCVARWKRLGFKILDKDTTYVAGS